jgi:hypothetical protein
MERCLTTTGKEHEAMSAPYSVWIYGPYGDRTIPFQTFDEALDLAIHEVETQSPPTTVRVIGDGYDCEQTYEGFRECSDGLTDAERERVEEAGL